MNVLVTVSVVLLSTLAMILGVIYLDKMTKKPKETLPVENPEVLEPVLPKNVDVKASLAEVSEPVKETVAPVSNKKPRPNKRKAK